MMRVLEIIAGPEDGGTRLDAFLGVRAEGLSRSRARTLIEAGAVTHDGAAIMSPRSPVQPGGVYTVHLPQPVPAIPQPEAMALDIRHEDADLIVVNKPAGMAVHPAPGSETGTLVNAILAHCEGRLPGIGGVERPGIVHRIDKLTSGLLVVAKTEAAHTGLSALFARHDIQRVYLAVSHGAPRPLSGTIDAPIARSATDRKRMSVPRNPDSPAARQAVTHYRALESFGRRRSAPLPAAALLECRLETGRTHQIRVHMAHAGAPLIGDPVYGRQRSFSASGRGAAVASAEEAVRSFPRQALHAAVLGFVHPVTGESLRCEAELPDDMAALIAALRALPPS